nr:unnamed protein product [Callosobruchus analis]
MVDELAKRSTKLGYKIDNYISLYEGIALEKSIAMEKWKENWKAYSSADSTEYAQIHPEIRSYHWYKGYRYSSRSIATVIRLKFGRACYPVCLHKIGVTSTDLCTECNIKGNFDENIVLYIVASSLKPATLQYGKPSSPPTYIISVPATKLYSKYTAIEICNKRPVFCPRFSIAQLSGRELLEKNAIVEAAVAAQRKCNMQCEKLLQLLHDFKTVSQDLTPLSVRKNDREDEV